MAAACSVEESRNIIRLVLNGPESYAICKKEDGRVIGAIALMLNSDSMKKTPPLQADFI